MIEKTITQLALDAGVETSRKEDAVAILKFAQSYADQEKRSTAIAFKNWTQFLYIPYKMKEGLYYHRKDLLKHIDEAMVLTTDQVYDAYLIYLQSLPKTV